MIVESTFVHRLALALLCLGFAVNALPKAKAVHCQESTSHSAHHHDHGPKDTDATGQCPHCPPIECRRQVECGSSADWVLVSSAELDPTRAPSPAPHAVPTDPATFIQSPPTPPPLGASV